MSEAVSEIEQAMRQRRLGRGMEAEIAAVVVIHRAATARFAREYLDLRRDPPPTPATGEHGLVQLMGRETGERGGQDSLQDS